MTFLTPLGSLIAIAVVVPLVAVLAVTMRAARVRAALRLAGPGRRAALVPFGAVGAVAALFALAATQPTVQYSRTHRVRADAQIFFVFDTSRSMLASRGPTGRSRLTRAKAEGTKLHALLHEFPAGIASLTDRTLPSLFPTTNGSLFASTLDEAVGIEQPPPVAYYQTGITTYAALFPIANRGFFGDAATHRLLVVFTDGESLPFDAKALAAVFRRPPPIKVLFIHVWGPGERVYTNGAAESGYRPDPRSGKVLEKLAASVGGASYPERQIRDAGRAARRLLGSGPTVDEVTRSGRLALAPLLVLGALAPVFLLTFRSSR
jgi:hypothetical protein